MVSTLWVTVSFIIVVASVCAFGYLAGIEPVPEGDGELVTAVWLLLTALVALTWPLILAVALPAGLLI